MTFETNYQAQKRRIANNIYLEDYSDSPAAFAWRIRDEARRLATLDRLALAADSSSSGLAVRRASRRLGHDGEHHYLEVFEERMDHYHEVLARIASAAPDLLDALEELVGESEPTDDPQAWPWHNALPGRSNPDSFGHALARAAIAKANGDAP